METPPNKSPPTGVKIISIIYYIEAALGILLGIAVIVGGGFLNSLNSIPGFTVSGSWLFYILGIFILAISVFGFFIGRNLWKGRNWARIVVIVFSVPVILVVIYMIFSGSIINGIINLVINGIIPGYLLFNQNAKEFFNN